MQKIFSIFLLALVFVGPLYANIDCNNQSVRETAVFKEKGRGFDVCGTVPAEPFTRIQMMEIFDETEQKVIEGTTGKCFYKVDTNAECHNKPELDCDNARYRAAATQKSSYNNKSICGTRQLNYSKYTDEAIGYIFSDPAVKSYYSPVYNTCFYRADKNGKCGIVADVEKQQTESKTDEIDCGNNAIKSRATSKLVYNGHGICGTRQLDTKMSSADRGAANLLAQGTFTKIGNHCFYGINPDMKCPYGKEEDTDYINKKLAAEEAEKKAVLDEIKRADDDVKRDMDEISKLHENQINKEIEEYHESSQDIVKDEDAIKSLYDIEIEEEYAEDIDIDVVTNDDGSASINLNVTEYFQNEDGNFQEIEPIDEVEVFAEYKRDTASITPLNVDGITEEDRQAEMDAFTKKMKLDPASDEKNYFSFNAYVYQMGDGDLCDELKREDCTQDDNDKSLYYIYSANEKIMDEFQNKLDTICSRKIDGEISLSKAGNKYVYTCECIDTYNATKNKCELIEEEKSENSFLSNAVDGVAMGAMGIGLSQTMSAAAEQRADAAATADMTALLNAIYCSYNNGVRGNLDEYGLQTDGMNAIDELRAEYMNLATSLKVRKESLGLTAGIESEEILDKADTGLYSNMAAMTEMRDGVYANRANAIRDGYGADAAELAESANDTKQKLTTGAITAAGGVVVGVAGDVLIDAIDKDSDASGFGDLFNVENIKKDE